ncbi:MAG: site-2 protease family protein [Patescibacteria group bacterium]
MNATNAVFYVAVLIMSVVIHEVCHGFMAEYFGDKTARHAGRLTLNPIKHLDLFGSIILPGILVLSGSGFLLGWAKPVPYNPANLSNEKWGTFFVALAGVAANFVIALVFGTIIRFSYLLPNSITGADFYFITSVIVAVNLSLTIFNLVPIPPLDGSKVLFSILPWSFYKYLMIIEQYSFIFLILFVLYFSNVLYPILTFMFRLVTGASL